MGIYSDVTESVVAAFDGDLADAVQSVTYKHVSVAFNSANNKNVTTTTDYLTRGVVMSYDLSEVADESVQPNDVAVLILQSELATIPAINDLLMIGTSEYVVVRVSQDSARVTWDLQCRN